MGTAPTAQGDKSLPRVLSQARPTNTNSSPRLKCPWAGPGNTGPCKLLVCTVLAVHSGTTGQMYVHSFTILYKLAYASLPINCSVPLLPLPAEKNIRDFLGKSAARESSAPIHSRPAGIIVHLVNISTRSALSSSSSGVIPDPATPTVAAPAPMYFAA